MNNEIKDQFEGKIEGHKQTGVYQNEQIGKLSRELVHALMSQDMMLSTVESCTGGWLSSAITGSHGASAVFDRGFVVYSNRSKIEMLGMEEKWLIRYGAVSPEVAEAMTYGALQHSDADIAISITGISGPSGGSKDKPVGLVYHCCQQRGQLPIIVRNIFNGDRASIRRQSVIKGLQLMLQTMA